MRMDPATWPARRLNHPIATVSAVQSHVGLAHARVVPHADLRAPVLRRRLMPDQARPAGGVVHRLQPVDVGESCRAQAAGLRLPSVRIRDQREERGAAALEVKHVLIPELAIEVRNSGDRREQVALGRAAGVHHLEQCPYQSPAAVGRFGRHHLRPGDPERDASKAPRVAPEEDAGHNSPPISPRVLDDRRVGGAHVGEVGLHEQVGAGDGTRIRHLVLRAPQGRTEQRRDRLNVRVGRPAANEAVRQFLAKPR